MKKTLAILLTIIMVICMIPMVGYAEEKLTISFETDFTNDLEVGDTFTVTGNLSNNPKFGAMNLSLKWNEKAVKFTGFKKNGRVMDSDVFNTVQGYQAPTLNETDGIIVATDIYGYDLNGKLFVANFEIVGDGALDIGLKTDDATEYMIRNLDGTADIPATLDLSALNGLTVGGAPVGPEIPEDAPFTAITTDAGEIIAVEYVEDVEFNYSTVPYYVVTIPADATTAYVTAPDQVVMEDWTTMEMKATGYAANLDDMSALYISYNYEDTADGPKVEIPMNMVASDWSGEVELDFINTHAFGIEDAGYACLGLISFVYDDGSADAETYRISIDETIVGGTITATNEDGEEITEAKAGDYVFVTVTPAEGYSGNAYYINGEIANDYIFQMPEEDVVLTATFTAIHTCTYDQEVADEKYLKSGATCENTPVYYKSCTCGEFAVTAETFTSGEELGHKFDNKVVSEETKATDATCENPATYYYTCDRTNCGVINNAADAATFEDGAALGHNFVNGVCTNDGCGETDPDYTEPAPETEGYTITMDADQTHVVGEKAEVKLNVGHEEKTTYNSYKLAFTYDEDVVTLTTESGNDATYTVTDSNGEVVITRVGDDLSVDADIVLNFDVIGVGETDIKLTEAYISYTDEALSKNAPKANIIDDNKVVEEGTTKITVTNYTVDLPEDFTGEPTVAPGKDYTFEAKDKNYDYTFAGSAMGDGDATVKDNGDGTFTVEKVNGNIVIKTEKTGKKFDVTLGDDMTGDATAQYMAEGGYTATLTKAEHNNYNVTVTIGGAEYTNFEAKDNGDGTVTYTIPGADIKGDIVFDSGKAEFAQFGVTFEGNGAGHAKYEDGAQNVYNGDDFSFAIEQPEGYSYTYTVTYKMGEGEAVELKEADGKYTIGNITANVVVTVNYTSDLAVAVDQYVQLDGKVMFLVTATQTLPEGVDLSYDGTAMFYSEQYNAWAFLVITEDTLSVDDAKAKITDGTATFTTLKQTYDVNGSDAVDINDAQLVYDMYNNEYQDFEKATMEKFLKADLNNSRNVDVNDVAAIITDILK